jgi:hypothetical protein
MPINKYFIAIFCLVLAGSIVGFFQEKTLGPSDIPTEKQNIKKEDSRASLLKRTNNLESNIAEIIERLSVLENELKAKRKMEGQNHISKKQMNEGRDLPETNALPVIDGLVKAGIDSFSAEEIVRKQSEAELRRLELRDTAIREGYIGTNRFREEIRKMRAEEIRIRDEIDATSYDKYLFYTGQPNRVAVASVIQGSVAEARGLKEGDRVLFYENQSVYNAGDLRSATTKGSRGDIINLTIQRRDTLLTVSVPRGPLGIRLESMSVDPTKAQ